MAQRRPPMKVSYFPRVHFFRSATNARATVSKTTVSNPKDPIGSGGDDSWEMAPIRLAVHSGLPGSHLKIVATSRRPNRNRRSLSRLWNSLPSNGMVSSCIGVQIDTGFK
jgi:hypothetical protein